MLSAILLMLNVIMLSYSVFNTVMLGVILLMLNVIMLSVVFLILLCWVSFC